MPSPAHLIILACQEQAGAGGESLVIDGQAVYRTLATEYPSELKAQVSEHGQCPDFHTG
jgi:alpha-ketoglutarate-dependent taurine dioxygenase